VLYQWDLDHKNALHPIRDDDSIYVSVASYRLIAPSFDLFFFVILVGRDEYCPDTLASLYKQASHPDKIFIGLVQQNCYEHCRSGVLEGLKVVDVGPDPDCKQLFCDTEVSSVIPPFLSHHFPQLGKPICARDQIRLFNINESESLGPYMGRFQESSSSF